MTKKDFFNINISIVKEKRNIKYKLCDGVVISFESYKIKDKDKYRLLLNGYEIECGQNYSSYAIKNSFLFVANNYNMHSFQWHPLADSNIYVINRDIKLPNKISWNDVSIVD